MSQIKNLLEVGKVHVSHPKVLFADPYFLFPNEEPAFEFDSPEKSISLDICNSPEHVSRL